MLSDETAKLLIQKAKTRADKAIVALAALGTNSPLKNVQGKLAELGEPSAKRWNLSLALSASGNRAIRTAAGWELSGIGNAEISKESLHKFCIRILID